MIVNIVFVLHLCTDSFLIHYIVGRLSHFLTIVYMYVYNYIIVRFLLIIYSYMCAYNNYVIFPIRKALVYKHITDIHDRIPREQST